MVGMNWKLVMTLDANYEISLTLVVDILFESVWAKNPFLLLSLVALLGHKAIFDKLLVP